MLCLLLGLFCCLGMLKTWSSHISQCVKNPLSNKYKKRNLTAALLVLWLIYPVLLANGMHTSGGWVYYSPHILLSWGKVAYTIAAIGFIINMVFSDWLNKHKVGFNLEIIIGICTFLGSVLRTEWYIAVMIWFGWFLYYYWKKPLAFYQLKDLNTILYTIKAITPYTVSSCLVAFMLINYFF